MKAITLFGKMLSFSQLKINTDNLDTIKAELSDLTKNNNTVPVVLDSECMLDLEALVELLWGLDIQPIGVVDGVLSEQAKTLKLAIFPADGKRIERIKASPKPDTTPKEAQVALPASEVVTSTPNETSKDEKDAMGERGITSVVHNHMLRSGQSLQHIGGDLIVIGGVNKGAEAITDNSLHIYGHGQGRLVAGATGDKNARIFCQKFDPTLVSVAGTYCLSDAIPPQMINKAVQVHYDENQGLIFSLMEM